MTRRRRWLPVLLLVGTVAVAFGLAWRAHLARPPAAPELDAAEPGWRLADRRPPADPLPDDQNAVIAVQAAYAFIPKGVGSPKVRALEVDTWPAALDAANAQVLDPRLLAWWRASTAAITAGRRVVNFPRGEFKVVPPDDLFVARFMRMFEAGDVAAHLHLDAALAARHGDPAGAVESVRALFHLGRVFGREPLDHSYHWGLGCDVAAAHGLARALAVAELPDADLAGLADELSAAAKPRLADALRDLRAVADDACDAAADGRTDNRTGLQHTAFGHPALSRASAAAYTTLRVRGDQVELRDRLTGFVAVAERPAHEWYSGLNAVPPPPADWQHLIQYSQDHAARGLVWAALWHQAVLRAARTAVGCERFRLANGRWPDALPEPVPTDPYTGRPLRFTRHADGLTVYSVGPDGTDDGGDLRPYPGRPSHQDVGIRLWDVAARRQPAEVGP